MKLKTIKESSWISFSDLMTALMLIFMFIAISYIVEVKKGEQEIEDILQNYENTKNNLYNQLQNEFENDFKNWQVELDDDLSIKFTNPDILFDRGSTKLTAEFKTILNNFLPRYFNVILNEKYIEDILEVRIEGHTDQVPVPRLDPDPYIGNIMLSQSRSTEVLSYFKKSDYYTKLKENDKEKLKFMLTSNGLSFGRMLDDNKELIVNSNNKPNNDLSRRVEFKIITKTEEAVDKVISKLKNK